MRRGSRRGVQRCTLAASVLLFASGLALVLLVGTVVAAIGMTQKTNRGKPNQPPSCVPKSRQRCWDYLHVSERQQQQRRRRQLRRRREWQWHTVVEWCGRGGQGTGALCRAVVVPNGHGQDKLGQWIVQRAAVVHSRDQERRAGRHQGVAGRQRNGRDYAPVYIALLGHNEHRVPVRS